MPFTAHLANNTLITLEHNDVVRELKPKQFGSLKSFAPKKTTLKKAHIKNLTLEKCCVKCNETIMAIEIIHSYTINVRFCEY